MARPKKTKTLTHAIGLKVDDETLAAIDRIAETEDRTRAAVARRLLKQALRRGEPRSVAS